MVACSVYKYETESNHVHFKKMVAPTSAARPPALLLTSLEKTLFGKNEHRLLWCTEIFVSLSTGKLKKMLTDVSPEIFTLVPVSKKQNTTNG